MICTFSDMYRYYGYFGHINTHIEKENPINKGKIRFSLHDIRSIRWITIKKRRKNVRKFIIQTTH